VADGEQAGEAGQQHQPQAHDGIDQHEGHLRQPVLGNSHGRGQQPAGQQAVPEDVPAMLGQVDVLGVAGLEDETHQTFLRIFRRTGRWA
jgi:hypothetical protein